MSDFEHMKKVSSDIHAQGMNIVNEIANLSEVSFQLADRFAHAGDMLTEIDKTFSEATDIINRKDLIFLFVATGLLCSKWLIMGQIAPMDYDFKHEPNMNDRDNSDVTSDKTADNKANNNIEKDAENNSGSKYRTINQILCGSVPYDAMSLKNELGDLTIPGTDIKLYSRNHHAYTMGHDPIFGWIFGTINILSRSMTLKQPFPVTYNVDEEENKICTISTLITELLESLGSVRENNKRLPAAVMRQGLHLASDKFCHTGLPIPFLSAEKAQGLIEKGWNSVEFSRAFKKVAKTIGKDVTISGIQFAISFLINEIIKAIHLLMYNEEKDGDLRLYQVRTRKILTVSNCISSSSNVLVSAGVAIKTKTPLEGAKRIDIGGFIETVHRLVVDTKFINEIKREYIKENLKAKILENDFTLLYGNYGGNING